MNRVDLVFVVFILFFSSGRAQENTRPSLAVGTITEAIQIDGVLSEADWKKAPVLNAPFLYVS